MTPPNDQVQIENLIAMLDDRNGLTRGQARKMLIEIGSPATPGLLPLLAAPKEQLRWEVAKVLSEIGDPATARHLVQSLHDESFGVRWLVSEGLIKIGADGLRPLLEALTNNAGSGWFRNGAQHVIRMLAGDEALHDLLTPVLEALHAVEPAVTVPIAAHQALQDLPV
jgi:HEAT repeat protein